MAWGNPTTFGDRSPISNSLLIQLRYAALDAAVLIAIFNALCCESSSRESAGTQHTSHWPSLVKQYGTYEKHRSWYPRVLPEADLAGASKEKELADNRISRTRRKQVDDVPNKSSMATGPWNFGAKWQKQPKPLSQETSSKATVEGRLGPAGGCWDCGEDHYKNECPENLNRRTRAQAVFGK